MITAPEFRFHPRKGDHVKKGILLLAQGLPALFSSLGELCCTLEDLQMRNLLKERCFHVCKSLHEYWVQSQTTLIARNAAVKKNYRIGKIEVNLECFLPWWFPKHSQVEMCLLKLKLNFTLSSNRKKTSAIYSVSFIWKEWIFYFLKISLNSHQNVLILIHMVL